MTKIKTFAHYITIYIIIYLTTTYYNILSKNNNSSLQNTKSILKIQQKTARDNPVPQFKIAICNVTE